MPADILILLTASQHKYYAVLLKNKEIICCVCGQWTVSDFAEVKRATPKKKTGFGNWTCDGPDFISRLFHATPPISVLIGQVRA